MSIDRRPERLLSGRGGSAALRRSRRSERRSRICVGERAFVRAAASSTASGSSSRRAQSSAISTRGSSWERSQKSATASDAVSGGTGYSTSPCTRSSSRLVTNRPRFGQVCRSFRELGCNRDDLLEVSSRRSISRSPMWRQVRPSLRVSGGSSPSQVTARGERRARPRRHPPCRPGRGGRSFEREAGLA